MVALGCREFTRLDSGLALSSMMYSDSVFGDGEYQESFIEPFIMLYKVHDDPRTNCVPHPMRAMLTLN